MDKEELNNDTNDIDIWMVVFYILKFYLNHECLLIYYLPNYFNAYILNLSIDRNL